MMLKKKEMSVWSRSTKIEGANLFLSDLQHILDEANRRELKVVISDADNEYSDLDELKTEKGERIRHLELRCKDPAEFDSLRIKLDLATWKVVPGQGDKLAALQLMIVELLNSRKPWHARFPGLFPTLGIAFTLMTIAQLARDSLPALAWGLFATAIVVFAISLICDVATSFSGIVYLKRAHELQSWGEEHGEKLFYAVLGTILGGSAKWLLEKFLP